MTVTYDVGDVVTLTWVYGASTTAAVTVTLPDGTTSTPSVSGSSTYTASFTTTLPGYHRVRWVGTGSNPGAYEDAFNVSGSTTEPILSLDDAKTFLRISNSSSDDEVRAVLEAVSDVCERFTKRVWRRTTYTETVSTCDSDYIYLPHVPVISVASVVVNGVTVTDYVVDKRAGALRRGTSLAEYDWEDSFAGVVVTYTAGPADGVVPANILQGCRLLLQHMWQTQRGGSNTGHLGIDGEYDARLGFYIPNRVRQAWGEPRILVR